MNTFELSRNFWNWAFENPEKINTNHAAIFFFAIEHCNRLGWKDKFGFPSQMVMEAIGIKNWRTYSNTLNDLVDFGFIEMIEISKNQYSSNIIAIVKNTKATTKALDKALQKHSTKQSQSIVSINKQITKNNKQVYKYFSHLSITQNEIDKLLLDGYTKTQIDNTLESIENYAGNKKYKSLYLTAKNWLSKEPKQQMQETKEPQLRDFWDYQTYEKECIRLGFTPKAQ